MADTQSALQPLIPYLDTLRWAFITMAMVGIAVTIYARWDDWRKGRRPVILAVASVTLLLYVAEVFVGASNIWFKLATSARIAHLALASAVWSLLVFGAAWGYVEHRGTRG